MATKQQTQDFKSAKKEVIELIKNMEYGDSFFVVASKADDSEVTQTGVYDDLFLAKNVHDNMKDHAIQKLVEYFNIKDRHRFNMPDFLMRMVENSCDDDCECDDGKG